jgi:putative protein kinase ArgK-like GTPase of G3E family
LLSWLRFANWSGGSKIGQPVWPDYDKIIAMTRSGATPTVNAALALADAVAAGDRRALARAITLVESTRPADQLAAEALLTSLLPRTGGSIRIGISGAPGVGKSTFIEAFGGHLTAQGKRIAVFAIDPSSRRSGGSILGDKTRMERLAYPSVASRHDVGRRCSTNAGMRPSRRSRRF